MTSIERGIGISNQRWGEKERGVREREGGRVGGRETKKEGHSLASDESERAREG